MRASIQVHTALPRTLLTHGCLPRPLRNTGLDEPGATHELRNTCLVGLGLSNTGVDGLRPSNTGVDGLGPSNTEA